MFYRIELEKIDRKYLFYGFNEHCEGLVEVKTFLRECIPCGFKVVKIVKVYKDGVGYDITSRFL